MSRLKRKPLWIREPVRRLALDKKPVYLIFSTLWIRNVYVIFLTLWMRNAYVIFFLRTSTRSSRQYCYMSTFEPNNQTYTVAAPGGGQMPPPNYFLPPILPPPSKKCISH